MRLHLRRNKATYVARSVPEAVEHRAQSTIDGIAPGFLTMCAAAILLLVVLAGRGRADTFGGGDNSFDIDFVAIGNPGNVASTIGAPSAAGAVDYVYRIGTYEISRDTVDKANADGALKIGMHSMANVTGGPRPEMPAAGVSWNEAARFVNWLNDSVGSSHAYNFAAQPGEEGYSTFSSILLWQDGDPGFDVENPFRNSQAKYVLPSVDEWFKAAFYDPNANDRTGGYWNYPTGSDVAPTPVKSGTDPDTAVYNQSQSQGPADITQAGGLSPYGVMGLGGNIFEWMETSSRRLDFRPSSNRLTRGNNWTFAGASELTTSAASHNNDANSVGLGVLGLRVASIPEPLACDSNFDGGCDLEDIDAMYDGFGNAGSFDFDGNGTVGPEDIGGWLTAASGPSNTALVNPADVLTVGDLDLNGDVNSTDLGLLLNNFGATAASAGTGVGYGGGDVNGSGNVDSTDLGLLLDTFGFTSASAATVPEPGAASMLLLAGMGLLGFARRRDSPFLAR